MDPSGYVPTPEEAAVMSQQIYTATDDDRTHKVDGAGDWVLDTIIDEKGLKMGIYSRVTDGTTEYALVNAGTDSLGDVVTDLTQPLVAATDDMLKSNAIAKEFVNKHEYDEVTMVGHSKGGAEAIANAVATNRNAITFNTAFPNLRAVGLSRQRKEYTGSITNYVVRRELINSVFGESSIGSTIYLRQQHMNRTLIYNMFRNHQIASVINALRAEETDEN
jgi:hypothetical protein